MKNLLTIEQKILMVRGRKVVLSNELAIFYGVEVRNLVQAVKRNADRFPLQQPIGEGQFRAHFSFLMDSREIFKLVAFFFLNEWNFADIFAVNFIGGTIV